MEANRRNESFESFLKLLIVAVFLAATSLVAAQAPELPTILVTRQLAEREGLSVGDTVELTREPAGGTRTRSFRVVGIYEPVPDPMRLGQARLEVRLHLPDLQGLTRGDTVPTGAERVDHDRVGAVRADREVAVHAGSPRLVRRQPAEPQRQVAGAEQILFTAGRQPDFDASRNRAGTIARQPNLRPYCDVGKAHGFRHLVHLAAGVGLKDLYRLVDPAMTGLAKRFPPLAQLAKHSLADKRVTIINDDAMVWVADHPGTWDVILVAR